MSHRLRGAILLLGLALSGAGAAQAQAAFEVMDRRGALLGWEAVGRLDTGAGFCTGTLIARDIVLTAAHCLYDDRGRPIAAERMRFRAGYHRGKSIADRKVLRWEAAAGYRDGGSAELNGTMIANDAALLRLDRDIVAAEADPFAVHQGPVQGSSVSVVSYGEGREDVLSRERRCAVTGRYRGGILAFDCDVTFGSSGAPVFVRDNGRLRILSVISGMGRDKDGGKTAFGMTLAAHVAVLKAKLRRDDALPSVTRGARRLGAGQRSATGARFVTP